MDENRALSILVVGLRTRNRPVDLLTVGAAIEYLVRRLGSVAEVARRGQVTPTMINRFRAVSRLSSQSRKLVASRKIDRVSDVHQLSRIEDSKIQSGLARIVIERGLSTKELRDVVTILLRTKSSNVESVVSRVVASRKRLEHVFAVGVPLPPGFDANKPDTRKRIVSALVGHGIAASGVGPIIQDTAMLFFTDEEFRRVRDLSRKSRNDVSAVLSRLLER